MPTRVSKASLRSSSRSSEFRFIVLSLTSVVLRVNQEYLERFGRAPFGGLRIPMGRTSKGKGYWGAKILPGKNL